MANILFLGQIATNLTRNESMVDIILFGIPLPKNIEPGSELPHKGDGK